MYQQKTLVIDGLPSTVNDEYCIWNTNKHAYKNALEFYTIMHDKKLDLGSEVILILKWTYVRVKRSSYHFTSNWYANDEYRLLGISTVELLS